MTKVTELKQDKLTAEEKAQLHLWARAIPIQQLNWLEGAQKIAFQSGAWEKAIKAKDKT